MDAPPGALGFLALGAAKGPVHLSLIVQSHAGFEVGPGQPVVHADLVFEDHQGDDVAMGREVKPGGEPILQVQNVDTVRVRDRTSTVRTRADAVAEVILGPARSRDVPATPALIERAGVVGAVRSTGENRRALTVGEQRAHQMAREALIRGGTVAEQTRVSLALEDRRIFPLLVERVEDRAENVIGGGKLHDVTPQAVTHHHVIIEVDGEAGSQARSDPVAGSSWRRRAPATTREYPAPSRPNGGNPLPIGIRAWRCRRKA